MSEKINQNIDYNNKYDNTDLVLEREARDLAAAYSKIEQMNAYKNYLETLKLESELSDVSSKKMVTVHIKDAATGKYAPKPIPVHQLLERPSEFEQMRRLVLRKLNSGDKITDEKLKQLMADYEVDGIFELSGAIANFIVDKTRRETNGKLFDMATLTSDL